MEILVKREMLLLGLGLTLAWSVQAKEGDTFRPFVSYSHNYDSNLFRLDESEYGLVQQKSDQFSVLSAGVNVDWQPSRQRIVALASKNFVRYRKYTHLDYDGSDYQLIWNWRVGNRWSGQIGATESVAQSSFSDLIGLRINNQVTRENRFINAEWQFHPRWSAGIASASARSVNSTAQQAPLDYEDTSVSATLIYTTPKESRLRAQVRRIDGEYPNRPLSYIDRLYTQTEYNLLGEWRVSGKLTAHGRVGYTRRKNDTQSQRDFAGMTGRISADFSPTGRTVLTWALYRELANSDDLNATYQVNTGTSLGGSWGLSHKITLRANGSYENRRFDGDTGMFTPGLVQRDEDTLNGLLSLSYAPVPLARFDIGVQAGRRDSNIAANDYRFHSVFVSIRADF